MIVATPSRLLERGDRAVADQDGRGNRRSIAAVRIALFGPKRDRQTKDGSGVEAHERLAGEDARKSCAGVDLSARLEEGRWCAGREGVGTGLARVGVRGSPWWLTLISDVVRSGVSAPSTT